MFDRFHSSIMPTIHQTGGYRPPVRKRHRLALLLDEREEISRGLVAKRTIRTSLTDYQELPLRLAARLKGMEVQNITVLQKRIKTRGTLL